jgi:predicted nucleic acid-binding protein
MGLIIDSSLWVDYFRGKTPAAIRYQAAQYINSAEARLCEPIRLEILHAARDLERDKIESTFDTVLMLDTPDDIWEKAILLGQKCVDSGFNAHSMDLLIAVTCLDADSTLITYDSHFAKIAQVCSLKLNLLARGD